MRIKNIEKVTRVYGDWKTTDIAFIKSLAWSIQSLEIVFYCQPREGNHEWPDRSKEFFELSLTFGNVSNLILKFSSKGLQQVSGFDISDVLASSLEGINFQIEDYEDGIIGFCCADIEINEMSGPINVNEMSGPL